ncbi:uncharacterized protein LOC130631194 [Hydractinia symbiolongicarpus]|uniref:uncharacterized protein LOC130631194 n=1 Tax=Hydractinia symbiolongicarpus TaxID=13093 RepID=UPI00254FFD4D|nr:uncharacterized protein LOC130631194 [Hydractinia symbiolongicarpus]XP_057300363.1 uncharacterized protein LOC130631194 [Hydractinia symbiolongicarpus]
MAVEEARRWDVMISYQHDDKEKVKRIADWLRQKGYSVWLDEWELQSNIYEAMSDGVTNSKIFMPCLTKAYDNSKNCRRELQFAADSCKDMIPLKLERYKPTGAVGLIIAGLKYYALYDGFNDTQFEHKMNAVNNNITHILGDVQEMDEQTKTLYDLGVDLVAKQEFSAAVRVLELVYTQLGEELGEDHHQVKYIAELLQKCHAHSTKTPEDDSVNIKLNEIKRLIKYSVAGGVVLILILKIGPENVLCLFKNLLRLCN